MQLSMRALLRAALLGRARLRAAPRGVPRRAPRARSRGTRPRRARAGRRARRARRRSAACVAMCRPHTDRSIRGGGPVRASWSGHHMGHPRMDRRRTGGRMKWLLIALVACSHASSGDTRERQVGAIHRGDKPLTLLGPTLDVGSPMPDVTVADGKLEPVSLASLKGKIVVLSVVPSIDTHVCETQTHKVSAAIEQMPAGVEVF